MFIYLLYLSLFFVKRGIVVMSNFVNVFANDTHFLTARKITL